MPKSTTIKRARRDARQGKSPSTQAGEFVREKMDELKKGRGNAASKKQAIAIGLSEARRSGVKLPAPAKGKATGASRKKARQDLKAGAKKRTRRRT